MITPGELRQKMLETGFSVTARRLTEWRSKGLLPPLASRGKGKGRGKIYFWKEPDILMRAQCLHYAFEHGANAEIAMLSLLHAGFEVEPKTARRIWIKHLAKLEKLSNQEIEPEESPSDFYWDMALRITPRISEQSIVAGSVLEPLIADALRTIYALRGFRPSPDEVSATAGAANQYLTAAMAASRYSEIKAPYLDETFITRALELIRKGLSVTATKELIKNSTIEQFSQAISATRLIIQTLEAYVATQVEGQSTGRPILEIRLLSRAVLGPPITAFFLELIGEGYERRLRESLRLLEGLISSCEANSGNELSPQNPGIPQQLQEVMRSLFIDFRGIWRDFSLFRLYHIA